MEDKYYEWGFIRNDGEPPVFAYFTDEEMQEKQRNYPNVRFNWSTHSR